MFDNDKIKRLEKEMRMLDRRCWRLFNDSLDVRADINKLKDDNEKHVALSASMTATIEKMSKLFVHSGITEKSVCDYLLKKLGPKWDLKDLQKYGLREEPGWWLMYDGSVFKEGGSSWEVLEYALEKKEEAKMFCQKTDKKSKKGGK